MLRRYLLGASSSGQAVKSYARRATVQLPYFLSSRSAYSTTSQSNVSQSSAVTTAKSPSSGNLLPKLVIGTVVFGAAVGAAYQTGYIGKPQVKHQQPSLKANKLDAVQTPKVGEQSQDQAIVPSKESKEESTILGHAEKNDENHPIEDTDAKSEDASEVIPLKEELSPAAEELTAVREESVPTKVEEMSPVKENDLPSFSQNLSQSDEQTTDLRTSSVNTVMPMKDSMEQNKMTDVEQNEVADTPISPQETTTKEVQPQDATLEVLKDLLDHEAKAQSSLSDTYSLQRDEERTDISVFRENTDISVPLSEEKEKVSVFTTEESGVTGEPESQKMVFELIEAIHAAEGRQAESDFRTFNEEKRKLKEKYEKELRDARARELMYAEEAAILEKELNKERVKAAATAKLLQEKAEEKLQMELRHKEEEAEVQLEKFHELHKAELNAAIAKEKLSHMEKMIEANLHIKALCMAFYAISEETDQSYSVHKLALGALALEDALSKGLPIREEIEVIHSSLVGPERDLLVDLVLTTLPEETLKSGTDTLLQLSEKFDALKGTLRHFSLIPPGGGGMLAHAVAHVASSIKMRECNQSGDGIESVISRVERFLGEGKLAEAADALEKGISGSGAEVAATEWVRRARNRAVTEQALTLLQAYATSVSLS
uniref:Formation of crista junctions protein 1 n=1 Tax=Anthurium amnicola TaxID=1678845 RepID=A0A1D1Y5E4_9ARAE